MYISLAALVVGAIVGFIVGNLLGKRNAAGEHSRQVMELSNQKSALEAEAMMLKANIVAERERAEEELNRQREGFKEQLAEQEQRNKADMEQLREEYRRQSAEQEQRFKQSEESRRAEFKQQLEQQLELVKSQLKQQTEQSNRESITEILRPYREQLDQMKQQSIEDRTTLQNEIKRFVETGGRLTREADRLVTALSGSVTIQGNLGEKLLKDLLAGSGLIEGVQYKLQHTVRNEDGTTAKNSDGRKMRPDAALIYPETNSILYIDSKFQLPSELDFENLDAESQRVVLKQFADKITDQAKKLSDRNYDRSNNEGYTPLPYVIMFVPSETALTAVTNFDRTLWQRMFSDYAVCLASERNLLVLIEMVRYMWQRQVTIDNYGDIIAKAEVVLDRVVDFMSEFSCVESSLAEAVKAAEKMRDLSSSRGHSIEVAVRNLNALGVKPHKVNKKDRPAQLKAMLQKANIAEDIEETTETQLDEE